MQSSDLKSRQFGVAEMYFDGYAVEDVEALMTQLAQVYCDIEQGRRPALASDDVTMTQLGPTRWFEGYDRAEVDQFLDEIAADLRERSGQLVQRDDPAEDLAAEPTLLATEPTDEAAVVLNQDPAAPGPPPKLGFSHALSRWLGLMTPAHSTP